MISFYHLLFYVYFISGVFGLPSNSVRQRSALAPLALARDPEKGIEDQYIVVFNEDTNVDATINSLTSDLLNATILHTYKHSLNGFAAKFNKETLHLIRANPAVAFVEQDQKQWAKAYQSPAGYNLAITSEKKKLAANNQTTFYYSAYVSSFPVYAYIIDTGIDPSHPEFERRAQNGPSFVSGEQPTDGNGHGTAMAGIIGARTYGVCKTCNMIGVKVLSNDGSGLTSNVIAGINYVQQNAAGKQAVINISIGGGYSSSVNNAVTNVIKSGVTTAVASGNEGSNACNVSPASTPDAITTGAMDGSYKVLSSNNYGSCIDIFAPGYNVVSTKNGGGLITLSGSSISSAHVTGVAGYLIKLFGTSNPANVTQKIFEYADRGFLTGVGSSPNVLLNNGYWKYPGFPQ